MVVKLVHGAGDRKPSSHKLTPGPKALQHFESSPLDVKTVSFFDAIFLHSNLKLVIFFFFSSQIASTFSGSILIGSLHRWVAEFNTSSNRCSSVLASSAATKSRAASCKNAQS